MSDHSDMLERLREKIDADGLRHEISYAGGGEYYAVVWNPKYGGLAGRTEFGAYRALKAAYEAWLSFVASEFTDEATP